MNSWLTIEKTQFYQGVGRNALARVNGLLLASICDFCSRAGRAKIFLCMGYDVYITRRGSWSDSEGPEISLDEWRAVVEQDAELIPVWSATFPGAYANLLEPNSSNPGARLFTYGSGDIFVKFPTRGAIRKMLTLARLLGARVIGESDEVYGEDGTADRPCRFEPDDEW